MKKIVSLRLFLGLAISLLVLVTSFALFMTNSGQGSLVQSGVVSGKTTDLKLEHIIIRVDDLQNAIDDFEALGFTVTPGGVHGGGFTHNALIHFQDASFIELIAFRKSLLLKIGLNLGIFDFIQKNSDQHLKYRFVETLNFPEGFIDSALLSHAIEADTLLARQRGLKTTPLMPFERKKPDQKIVRWGIMTPLSSALPFVRGPYIPEQIISANLTKHQNGAMGLENLQYAVKDLPASIREYEHLLGIAAQVSTINGKRVAKLKLGDASISLLPVKEHLLLAEVVHQRRDLPIQLTLRTSKIEHAGLLPIKNTHGAKIIMVLDLPQHD